MRNAAAGGNFCLSALVAHDVCKVNLVSGITDHSHLNLIKSPGLSALGSRAPCYIKLFKYIPHLDLGRANRRTQRVFVIYPPMNISKRWLFSDVFREASSQIWYVRENPFNLSCPWWPAVFASPAGTGLTTCLGCSLNSRPMWDSRWLQCQCGDHNSSPKSFFTL